MIQETPVPGVEIDTGSLGCGLLLMRLLQEFRGYAPGTVVAVRSEDLGARADIPAWCRMRGHALLATEPGDGATRFFIQRGEKL